MPCPFLLLELVLRRRAGSGQPNASTGFALSGAHAIELDAELRRLRSHRLGLSADAPAAATETFETEPQLLARVLSLIGAAETLVTGRGRQLEVPVLEALALRYGQLLLGHFPLEEPYAARRSPYNPAGHLDLSFFLADGDRRLRSLGPEMLVALTFPGAVPVPRRQLETDDLAAARRRALAGYLLLLRVQELRGKLDPEAIEARKAGLGRGLAPEDLALVEASRLKRPATYAATRLEDAGDGALAFDIETALDVEALGRCLGRPVSLETAPAALGELLGAPTDFAPAPFHRVVAIAMVHWGEGRPVELERLVLGGHSGAGAPLPDEASLLTAFWRVGRGKRLVSYNGKRFDLPVLLYRSLPYPLECGWFLEEKRPPHTQYRHPQSQQQLDVFEQLSGGLSPGRLGDLLQTVGLPGKQGTSGHDVEDLWARGDLAALGDYCLSDAAQTFLLGVRFMEIAGQLDPEVARRVLAAARARFGREPALQPMLAAASPAFFGAGGSPATAAGDGPARASEAVALERAAAE